jgi:Tol biopolymer transport system component
MTTRLASAVLLLLLWAGPASAAFPGTNGKIGYGWTSSDEPELGPPFRYERAIRTVRPDGTGVRTVLGCTSSDRGPVSGNCAIPVFRDPAFSPDGELIAFDAGPGLALVRPDGTGLRMLAPHGTDDGEPAFSPPGGRLTFGSDGDVWVSKRNGSDARRIVRHGSDPVWSTRGWIAFTRSGRIWRVRPGGDSLQRLTGRAGTSPAWSPHGTKLAFARGDTIFILDLHTRSLRHVIGGTGALSIAWSPDGRRLAWTTFDGSLLVARTDGSRERQLVFGGSNATQSLAASGVDWQPRR